MHKHTHIYIHTYTHTHTHTHSWVRGNLVKETFPHIPPPPLITSPHILPHNTKA